MSRIKQTIRTNQALQVIQHSNDGMSIIDACLEVGIPRSTFYYFIYHHPDAISHFQEMKLLATLQQFELILTNQTQILERVIQDGLADTTKPRQRLAIYKELSRRADELMEQLNASLTSSDDLSDLLSGPTLIAGESRFSSAG